MNDNARTIVVGMMQTPPYDHMFESMRRVYSAKGLCPSCLTHGGQPRDKSISGTIKRRLNMREFVIKALAYLMRRCFYTRDLLDEAQDILDKEQCPYTVYFSRNEKKWEVEIEKE